MDIDGTVLSVDAAGVVTGGVPIDVKKNGKKVTVTLPSPPIDTSTITLGGALSGGVDVASHYTHSLGRFKLEAESGDMLPDGASTLPRSVGMMIGVGAPLYPGECGATEPDIKVYSQEERGQIYFAPGAK